MEIRDAEQEDLPFLIQMAKQFGQDESRYSVKDWKLRSDAGLIAVDEEGRDLGAAWYRLEQDIPEYGVRPRISREVFIAVTPESRSRGVATQLLGELIERARADPGIDALVAIPVQSGASKDWAERLCQHFKFKQNGGRWILLTLSPSRRPWAGG